MSRRRALIASLLVLAQSAVAAEVFRETVEQECTVDSDATLSIRHTDGSVRIYGGDGQKITIQAIKNAYLSDRLKGIVIDVKATPKSVTIETLVPKDNRLSLEDRSGTVDYVITVPSSIRMTGLNLVTGEILVEGLRGGSATAHVVNGWLIAYNCFGDLDFTLVNGRLEVAYDWWEDAKFSVKLASAEGRIRAIIPRDASVSIIARTPRGRIVNTLGAPEVERSEPVHAMNFITGPAPKTVFEMNSISGDIRIEKAY